MGLALNETAIAPGQTISITVYERNTLQETNNVSASDMWPINGLSIGPCGALNMPFGIVVYRGNTSVLAVPGVQPLELYKPGPYYCPMILSGTTAYVFQPASSEAQVLGSCSPNPCFSSNMSSTINVRGHWGTSLIQFSNFDPGIYTVVAGDEWGQHVVLSFDVTQSGQSTVPAALSSDCGQPPYLFKLASMVEQTQVFAQQAHGLSYVIASGNNDSATTGVSNGEPYYSPPETNLALYSYGSTPAPGCPSELGYKGVVGALWIRVPIERGGSYNLTGMSIYFTPGVFANGTASSSSPVGTPRVLLGYVSARGVTCSLSTGVCTMTLLNNSTVPLAVTGCNMSLISNSNGTSTTWNIVNGKIGGPALAGITAGISYGHGSIVSGSCTVPKTALSLQTSGSLADGLIFVQLESSRYDYPAGTWAVIDFQGTWS